MNDEFDLSKEPALEMEEIERKIRLGLNSLKWIMQKHDDFSDEIISSRT